MPARPLPLSPDARQRASGDARHRAAGVAFVAIIHGLLLLLFATLAPPVIRQKVVEMVTFNISEPPAPKAEAEAEPDPATPAPAARPEPTPPRPVATPPEQPVIEIPPEIVEAVEQAPPPVAQAAPPASAPRRPMMGPPAPGPRVDRFADSERVDGTGPNGEPLYAASWYREPYPDELSGFLSTAQGPGWGMIACRTAPNYRVEDCVIVGEYPQGSRIARSVLAAAWQFRVRPPQIGGRPQVGEWVRIRIDYLQRPG